MKFKSLPFIAAAAMLSLASCSSDEPAQNPGSETGTSYLNVSINLPSVDADGSRAEGDPYEGQGNDQFEDGEASEYAVYKAHLVIFKGDSEATAVVKNIYEMTTLKPWNQQTSIGNVTTTAQTVQKINDAPADDLWVLIVLNDNNAKTHFANGTKFSDLTGVASNMDFSENGFFMTNAPLYISGEAKTLVKIAKEDIKSTQEAALSSTAIKVYVERAVAKVQVIDKNTEGSNKIEKLPFDNGEGAAVQKNYTATITKWAIDLTNNKSYLVRNVSDFSDWKGLESKVPGAKTGTRFFSSATQRIFWAKDHNYNTNPAEGDLYSLVDDKNKDTKFTTDPGKYVYCRENTFNVAHQNRNETTRVILKAKFKAEGETEASTFYTFGQSNTIYNKEGLRQYIISKAVELLDGKKDRAKYFVDGTQTVSKTRGKHKLSRADVKYGETAESAEALSEAEIQILNDAFGSDAEGKNINTYLNGECFYVARVQHFGETYTPWIPGSATYGTENVDDNYLGRYGVLRNNWYSLEVSGIKTLGKPDVPEAPTTPDDENNYYISVRCNVHSWAKRVQNVVL